MNQERAPYFEALKSYVEEKNTTFHVPGHQHGKAAPPEFLELLREHHLACDITEVWGLDHIHDPTGPCGEAQDLVAKLYGADRSYFLINGSTVGNQAMFLTCLAPGDSVVFPLGSHRSAYAALLLSGATGHPFATQVCPEALCAMPPTPEEVDRALELVPQAKAVFITSPNYHGACADLRRIVEVARQRDVLLMVDEAWGAHFGFLQAKGLQGAISAGADLVVQSAHKLGSALTQGAYLHLRGSRVDEGRLESVLRHLQSSSPSSLLIAGLDCARRQMALHGRSLWSEAKRIAEHLRSEICGLEGIHCRPAPEGWDPCRVIVEAVERGYSGFHLERVLRLEHGIQVEMSELHQVILLITPGHTLEHSERLLAALASLPVLDSGLDWREVKNTVRGLFERESNSSLPGYTPRDAFYAPTVAVGLENAVDQTSAELLYCYPPGVPFVFPGGPISRRTVTLMERIRRLGGRIQGGHDPTLQTIQIVDKQ